MLQLDVQSHSELLDIEARCLPVDADPLSNVASLIGRERAWTHGNKCDGSRTDALMQVAEHPVKAGGCGRGATYRANGKAGPAQPGRCAPANRQMRDWSRRPSPSAENDRCEGAAFRPKEEPALAGFELTPTAPLDENQHPPHTVETSAPPEGTGRLAAMTAALRR